MLPPHNRSCNATSSFTSIYVTNGHVQIMQDSESAGLSSQQYLSHHDIQNTGYMLINIVVSFIQIVFHPYMLNTLAQRNYGYIVRKPAIRRTEKNQEASFEDLNI